MARDTTMVYIPETRKTVGTYGENQQELTGTRTPRTWTRRKVTWMHVERGHWKHTELAGLAIGQFVPVLDLELTRDFRAPGNPLTHAELHRPNPKVCTELMPELEASGPS